jgi:hypothetical protein
MKLTDNEKALVKAIVDYEAHVNEATQYLKETYNIDAEFNIENGSVRLTSNNINESSVSDLISAKLYILELFPNNMLNIEF